VRRAALAMGALALAACEPEIISGTYFCGPERGCPPDLACDGATLRCVRPEQVEPFRCAAGSQAAEPDDELASAQSLGVLGCRSRVVDLTGCIADAADVDHLRVEGPAGCNGTLQVVMHHPVALADLALEVLDEAGQPVAAGAVCLALDVTGRVRTCVEAPIAPGQIRIVRVRGSGAGTCDGDCAHNQYYLSLH
jgi:hypothetical protein